MRTVADATKQLRQRYNSSRFSSSVDEWPPYQPKHYTTLAFIHNKGKHTDAVRFSVAQELAVAGKIHTAQPYKLSGTNINMTKSISDIFLPVKAPDGSFIDLHILIEGAPGIGKTVLAKEIAYQWAKNELLASKNLLLLVFLRECSQMQLKSFKQLVQYVFRNDETASHLTNYLSKGEGEGAVIILDGFDELSEENRKNSLIVDIINRRILAKSCLVITSRPAASSNLHGSVDRRVEIVGFTEEDRLNYIQAALENSDEQIKALQHYLQSNPTINALCYIPLNMTILLCLVEDGINALPKTQTELYEKFIKMTIIRFFKRFEKGNTVISIAELPHPHDKLFVELAKLAYEALKTDKIVFTLPEIKKACPNLTMTSSNWSGLGLLKAVQYFSAKMGDDQVTFHFLHFSIQEYMAAWYISTLSQGKQGELLRNTFWKHRYYNTWIMYVGITCGSTFALRHFLSGNWFYSKLFRNSKVSKKYLENKMKCLHLFQCLVEANKEDIIISVKQLFQSNRIDLSNQALLPSDLNTLGFFLVRSINKEWDELDLSYCNIGSKGSNILCDRFLDKDVRSIITIKMINFSYNQLNCSSLIRLFGLFNSWHTSEIFITDDAILDNKADNKAIEDIVLQSDMLLLVFIGSYLYSRNLQLSKMIRILSNTTNVKSIYLLNCSWKSNDSKTSELLILLLKKQKLNKVRVIGPSLDKVFIKTMASILLHNSDPVNMFVYDPTMSDEFGDEIADDISSSSDEDISGVMIIVSSSKVQGVVNICTLSNELSALELFNLKMYVRLFKSEICSWRNNFKGKSDSIIYTFVEMLHVIKSDWQLKIVMIENDVLIAHKAKRENMNKWAHSTDKTSVIYLSSCDFAYDIVNESCSVLNSLNSQDCVELLHTKLLHKQSVPNELFIYGNIEDSLMNSLIELVSHYHHNISAVLAANDVIVGHNPNIQQIALAFQLQPSPTKWVLCSPVSDTVFHRVVNVLVTPHIQWTKLDFTCCNIGDIEYEIMSRNLEIIKHSSTIRKLNISFNKLSVSGIPYLVRIILIWRVEELFINGTNDVLFDCLIKNLTTRSNHQYNFFLYITYSNKLLHIVCNTNWNKIVTKMDSLVSRLYIINCELNSKENISYLNISHNLLRLCVINGTISETTVIEILKTFLDKAVEVSISNVRIIDDDKMIRNFITSKKFCLDIKLSLVLSTDHWLCVCNTTKYQLHLIHQYFMNQTQPHCYGMSLIRKLEQINGDKMCIFENDLVNFVRLCGKAHQMTDVTHVIAALSHITSLNTIEIDNYSITSETASHLVDIIYNNAQLQEICLNGNNLQINATVKIAKALYCIRPVSCGNNNLTDDTTNSTAAISTVTSDNSLEITGSIVTAKAVSLHNVVPLTKFYISNNNVTDEAADDIATAISCNSNLQELNLGSNNLQTSGTIKVARSLQGISSLTKLYINHNNITYEAAEDIGTAISNNIHLQELNLGSNNLQTSGIIKIAKSLQRISSLTKLYINHNNITHEAAEDIGTAISCNIHLQELNLGSNNLQTLGTIKIAKSLQRISSLRKLYINHNNIAHEAADDIAAAISNNNNNIQELNLGSNNLQTSGTLRIAKSLRKISSLTKLYINHNNITHEAADDIAAAISNNNLQELNLGSNNLQTSGTLRIAKSLRKISSLTKLYINHNNITHEAADDIAAAISNNQLQELNLGSNNLQTSGTIKVAKSLQKISSLTKLYINHNNITHEAADDIAAVVSCNTTLQEFSISGNDLQTTGVIKIVRALKSISTLRKLYLSDNNITDEVADDIATAISCNTEMKELDISGNNFQAMGASKIAKNLRQISTPKTLLISNNNNNVVVDDISGNLCLQDLYICGNIQSTGANAIIKALQGIFTLTKLHFGNNNISDEAANDIAAVVSCNTKLKEFEISGNKLQTTDVTKIMKALQGIHTLKKLYLNNNNITEEAADDIAAVISCNNNLQELNLGTNNLQTSGTKIIARSLKKISSLTKLYINHNNITHEAAEDIAAAIYCNISLQELNLGGNDLQTSGTKIIARSLKKISSLTKLYINHNNITHEAVDDIVAAIYCNISLQELNLGGNDLETSSTMEIAKCLRKVSSISKLHINRIV